VFGYGIGGSWSWEGRRKKKGEEKKKKEKSERVGSIRIFDGEGHSTPRGFHRSLFWSVAEVLKRGKKEKKEKEREKENEHAGDQMNASSPGSHNAFHLRDFPKPRSSVISLAARHGEERKGGWGGLTAPQEINAAILGRLAGNHELSDPSTREGGKGEKKGKKKGGITGCQKSFLVPE